MIPRILAIFLLLSVFASGADFLTELNALLEKRRIDMVPPWIKANKELRPKLQDLLDRAAAAKDVPAITRIAAELKDVNEIIPLEAPKPVVLNGLPSVMASKIELLLVSHSWSTGAPIQYTFGKISGITGIITAAELKAKGHYRVDGKTGLVSIAWEEPKAPLEGLQYYPDGTFVTMKGEPFLTNR